MRIVAAATALALLAGACTASAGSAPGAPGASPVPAAAPGAADAGERRSEAGSVTIVASWSASGTPTARVVLDTHSVDLDGFDLAQLARVRLDAGAWVAPSGWDAPKGGHHREGTLSFAALDRQAFDSAKVIELEIQNVAAPSRLLRWERSS